MSQEIATLPEPTELIVSERLPADQNPAAVYIARLGKRSQRVMAQALDVIAGILTNGQCNAASLPWHRLRYQHTEAVRAVLADRYSPASANRMLAALKGTLKAAWRMGLMDAESFHRTTDLAPVRGETLPAGREVTGGELRALFEVCAEDASPAGPRDAAILTILYAAGLRRGEATALDVDDYTADTGELRIRRGKGNKARIVYATNGGKTALDTWLSMRGTEPGPLLCPVNKGGKITVRRMTDDAVLKVLQKRSKQTGVAKFTPHDLRRTHISHLLDAGVDISTVRRLAGHSSVTTTVLYDRRGEEAKRKAAELIHVPYTGPEAE